MNAWQHEQQKKTVRQKYTSHGKNVGKGRANKKQFEVIVWQCNVTLGRFS